MKKAKTGIKSVFDHAIEKGLIANNPVTPIGRNAFTKHIKSNFRFLPPQSIYEICAIFKSLTLSPSIRLGIEFQIRTLTRPSEASQAEWTEIDFDKKIWTISVSRMKMARDHVIPLSDQAIKILNEMKKYSETSKYIFVNSQYTGAVNRESFNNTFKRYEINTTAHGLRHLASTVLNESRKFDKDIIEVSLSHQDKNTIRTTYNKAQYLEEHRELLQWWSDFMDRCDTEENNLEALRELKIV